MLLVQSSHRNTTMIVSSIVWKVYSMEGFPGRVAVVGSCLCCCV